MYKWTVPIVGEERPGDFQFGYLALPERFISEEEYQRLVKTIELFRYGLVLDEPDEDEACEWGRMSLFLLEAGSLISGNEKAS